MKMVRKVATVRPLITSAVHERIQTWQNWEQQKTHYRRVQSEEKAAYVTEVCEENNWIFILGMEPDKPEDLSDLERMLRVN